MKSCIDASELGRMIEDCRRSPRIRSAAVARCLRRLTSVAFVAALASCQHALCWLEGGEVLVTNDRIIEYGSVRIEPVENCVVNAHRSWRFKDVRRSW